MNGEREKEIYQSLTEKNVLPQEVDLLSSCPFKVKTAIKHRAFWEWTDLIHWVKSIWLMDRNSLHVLNSWGRCVYCKRGKRGTLIKSQKSTEKVLDSYIKETFVLFIVSLENRNIPGSFLACMVWSCRVKSQLRAQPKWVRALWPQGKTNLDDISRSLHPSI